MKSTQSKDKSTSHVAIRLGHLGDAVLATGVLDHWRKTMGARFAVITKAPLAPVFENHPAVEKIHPVEPDRLDGMRWLEFCREMTLEYPGATLVDLHGNLRSLALYLMWKSQNRRYPKFSLERRLYRCKGFSWAEKKLEALNVPQRYALALDRTAPDRALVRPRLFLSPSETAWARSTLKNASRHMVIMHPYATHPNKAWPAKKWLELAEMLASQGMDYRVVGSSHEPITFPGETKNLTNRTDLRQTMALIAEADALVTSDSGPMHMGTATGTPVTALFGPTAKAWGFYPSGEKDVVLERSMDCRPCSLHGKEPCPRGRACLDGIGVEEVLGTVTDSIRKK